MSWYSFQPYVSVAEQRKKAAAALKKLTGQGRKLAPVALAGRKIASTFWGKAWCDNLEAYSDFANRLPRGRTYVRNGSVIDLQITHGKIEALVQGSSLYTVSIAVSALKATHWQQFRTRCSGKITNLLDLLQGRLSNEILADATAQDTGLFPSPDELTLQCSCPDWAMMCKHAAAVLYGIGARLDSQPELFFTLRTVEMQELISAASTEAIITPAPGASLDDTSLSEIFGVEIEVAAPPPAALAPSAPAGKPSSATRKKSQPPAKPSPTAKKTSRKAKAPAPKGGKTPAAKHTPKPTKKPASKKRAPAKAQRRKAPAARH